MIYRPSACRRCRLPARTGTCPWGLGLPSFPAAFCPNSRRFRARRSLTWPTTAAIVTGLCKTGVRGRLRQLCRRSFTQHPSMRSIQDLLVGKADSYTFASRQSDRFVGPRRRMGRLTRVDYRAEGIEISGGIGRRTLGISVFLRFMGVNSPLPTEIATGKWPENISRARR